MCGIVGVAGYISSDIERLFTSLLLIDVLRGKDSTGVIKVNNDSQATTYLKMAEPSPYFIDTKEYQSFMNTFHSVLVGHNRAATFGKVTHENAHPFMHSNIVGVHNGTLSDVSLLPKHKDFDVDSDNLIYSIATDGIKATYEKLDGAAALVWYDISNSTLYFLRNSERPLHYGYLERYNTLVWSSDPNMLRYAIKNTRNCNLKDDKVYMFKEDTLHSFVIPKNTKHGQEMKPKLRPLEPYIDPFPTTTYYGRYSNYKPNNSNITNVNVKRLPSPTNQSKSVNIYSKGPLKIRDTIYAILDSYEDKGGRLVGYSHQAQKKVLIYVNGQKDLLEICKGFKDKTLDTVTIRGVVNWFGAVQGIAGDPVLDPSSINILSKVLPEKKFKSSAKKPTGEVVKIGTSYLAEEDWNRLVSQGCKECGDKPLSLNADELYWEPDGSFLCSDNCIMTQKEEYKLWF